MRRLGISAGALALAIALLAGGAPARAGTLEFTDPEGDATGLSEVESTPRPSEPELDILNASYVSDGKTLTVSSQVLTLADPVASGGAAYRWAWVYDGIVYELVFQLPTPPTDTVFVRGGVFRGDGATISIDCCKPTYDTKTNTIGLAISLSSIAKGVKTTSPDSPAFGPGSTVESIRATSQRSMGALLVSADWATPKEGTTLTV